MRTCDRPPPPPPPPRPQGSSATHPRARPPPPRHPIKRRARSPPPFCPAHSPAPRRRPPPLRACPGPRSRRTKSSSRRSLPPRRSRWPTTPPPSPRRPSRTSPSSSSPSHEPPGLSPWCLACRVERGAFLSDHRHRHPLRPRRLGLHLALHLHSAHSWNCRIKPFLAGFFVCFVGLVLEMFWKIPISRIEIVEIRLSQGGFKWERESQRQGASDATRARPWGTGRDREGSQPWRSRSASARRATWPRW